MFRIFIILLLGLLIFRLGAVLLRGLSGNHRRRKSDGQKGEEVGEGKIVKDEIDNSEKKEK